MVRPVVYIASVYLSPPSQPCNQYNKCNFIAFYFFIKFFNRLHISDITTYMLLKL